MTGQLFLTAVSLNRAGRYAEAESLLTSLLAQDPHHPDILHLLAELADRDGRHTAALDLVFRAISQRPEAAVFHRTAAGILRHLGRDDAAMDAIERAVTIDPRDQHSLITRSSFHLARLAIQAALADAQHALKLDPTFAEAHLRLGELHLMSGEFTAGWPEYEWNDRIFGAPPALPPEMQARGAPHWDGTRPVEGTLLLVADQGFGDTIQFARYIPWARHACRHIACACDPALLGLLSPLGIELFDRWSNAPPFVAWAALSHLPRLHGTTLATIPPHTPPLSADPAASSAWQARLSALCPTGARRIGLVWAGRPTHPNDIKRSASLADLAPIASCDGVFLVSLQQGPARDQIAAYRGAAPLLDVGRLLGSFADTAAVIAGLDLVITVDTSVAHLAGAMGKPVWIMLPYAPDWRWLLDRDDSPWYPTARLFRQTAHGGWPMVARDVAAALE